MLTFDKEIEHVSAYTISINQGFSLDFGDA